MSPMRPPVPVTPPQLLAGPPAVEWVWRTTRWLIISGLFGLASVVGMVLLPGAPEGVILGLLIAAIASAILGLPSGLRGMDATRAEHAAGYTTLNGMEYRYWQLEPKTGKVLRRPGERTVHREGIPRESFTSPDEVAAP
jgi:hypothetical protein